jgi:hypothetical protein
MHIMPHLLLLKFEIVTKLKSEVAKQSTVTNLASGLIK